MLEKKSTENAEEQDETIEASDMSASWWDKIASDKTIQDNYEAVRGVASDAHSVKKWFAAVIPRQPGLEWTPGQLYCCLHTVLRFQEGMTKTWLRYQEKVGYDKMYPSITRLELDMEDKSLIKQIPESFLRLTADRWRERNSSRFSAYCKFLKDLGRLNLW